MSNSASRRKIYNWPISKNKLFHILSKGNANYSHYELPLHTH